MPRPPTSTLFPYTTLFRSHPPRARVWRKRAGLENRRRSIRALDFIPPHRRAAPRRNRVRGNQRLVAPEIAIRQPEHEPLSERVELLACAGLRDTRSSRPSARVRIRRYRNGNRPGERRIVRVREIHMELIEIQRI